MSAAEPPAGDGLTVADLALCFEGAVPAVVATASADGVPNVTYLSRVRAVDHERVALSNQFFSKTVRNLAENPRASVLLIDPTTYDEYRLTLVYERTERRGPVFERLREDVDTVAALEGMQDVFRLRSADIYRVLHIEELPAAAPVPSPVRAGGPAGGAPGDAGPAGLAAFATRLSRCGDLDAVVGTTVRSLDELLGYEHAVLLLADEDGRRLYTIASNGYDDEQIGSEAQAGEGVVGLAAQRCTPLRVGNLLQVAKYSHTVRRAFEEGGDLGPGRQLPLPGLPDAQSQVAVPLVAQGELVGVLLVERDRPVAFTEDDVALLGMVGVLVAALVQLVRAEARGEPATSQRDQGRPEVVASEGPVSEVRFFAADGSVFLDQQYLVKGVPGRILWSLLDQHRRDGRTEFTNREIRLDPTIELPEYRDNLESRLILLKRRLEERRAPVQMVRTGRGRFALEVDRPLSLVRVDP